MLAQSGEFAPGLASIRGAEQSGVLNSRIDGIGIGQRGFQMPDSFELPRMRRAIVPLMRARYAVIFKLVTHRFPGLASVVRTLDHLSGPAARLGGIQSIRISGRSFDVVELPAREVRTA